MSVRDMMFDRIDEAQLLDDVCQYVTVSVGGQLFGLPIARVRDVFIASVITPVPLAPPQIRGLLNLRGRVVTALCLRRRLGLPPGAEDGDIMTVGLESGSDGYGLIVDSVGEVVSVRREMREPPPANLDARWAAVARGVHRLNGKLLIVLHVDALLAFGNDGAA